MNDDLRRAVGERGDRIRTARAMKEADLRPEQPHVLEEVGELVVVGCFREGCTLWDEHGQSCKVKACLYEPENSRERRVVARALSLLEIVDSYEAPAEREGLPTYSGIESVCAKCGSHGAAAVKYFAEDFKTASLNERIPEHLRRTCDICGYAWVEACVEKEETP